MKVSVLNREMRSRKNPEKSKHYKAWVEMRLGKFGPQEKQVQLAKDLKTKPKILKELACDYTNHEVLCVLLQNPSLPAQALEHLWRHPLAEIRILVAKHPNTPPMILYYLTNENTQPRAVLEQVALHPNLSERDVRDLWWSRYEEVRGAVASHPKFPKDLLDQALADQNEAIFSRALHSPNITKGHLRTFFIYQPARRSPESILKALVHEKTDDELVNLFLQLPELTFRDPLLLLITHGFLLSKYGPDFLKKLSNKTLFFLQDVITRFKLKCLDDLKEIKDVNTVRNIHQFLENLEKSQELIPQYLHGEDVKALGTLLR